MVKGPNELTTRNTTPPTSNYPRSVARLVLFRSFKVDNQKRTVRILKKTSFVSL